QMRMLSSELRGKSVTCPCPKEAALCGKRNVSYIGLANPGGRFDQCIEHGLQIEGRAADDLEHVGGGGLLLQRLRQIAIARLQLGKQPYVLDCDDRLVGERSQ